MGGCAVTPALGDANWEQVGQTYLHAHPNISLPAREKFVIGWPAKLRSLEHVVAVKCLNISPTLWFGGQVWEGTLGWAAAAYASSDPLYAMELMAAWEAVSLWIANCSSW